MKHTLHIPFPNSIEKVNQFISTADQPMKISKYRFPNGNLQVFVKPWQGKPYEYVITCKVAEKLPVNDYNELYHRGKALWATIMPNGECYDIEITDDKPKLEIEKDIFRDAWLRFR